MDNPAACRLNARMRSPPIWLLAAALLLPGRVRGARQAALAQDPRHRPEHETTFPVIRLKQW
jgi:hypothetical protein